MKCKFRAAKVETQTFYTTLILFNILILLLCTQNIIQHFLDPSVSLDTCLFLIDITKYSSTRFYLWKNILDNLLKGRMKLLKVDSKNDTSQFFLGKLCLTAFRKPPLKQKIKDHKIVIYNTKALVA